MSRKKLIGCVCAVAMLAGLTAATASAQTSDKRTYFTFTGPVEMPGVGLPPGKYVFRVANPDTTRTVVQVMSADGKRVYGMFFGMSAQRRDAPKDAEVRFMEAPAGTPPAIKTWWHPGERLGYEFVYPKQQARRIAERSHESVLTTQEASTTTNETDTAALTRISTGGDETRLNAENATADLNPSALVQKEDPAPAPVPTQVATVAEARTELPRTAGSSPLAALVGVSTLLAAAAVHFARTRRV